MRIACGIEYCGASYFGWQSQANDLPTIQSNVESALSRVADHPVNVIAAGRTDKGVHATQQIFHFDTHSKRENCQWLLGANSYLPKDIRILWVKSVDHDFHAQFAARFRRYCYILYISPLSSAFFNQQVTLDHRNMNVHKMQSAAQYLVGEHDFSSFRASQCQASHPNRYIHFIEIDQVGPFIKIDIQANGFLHHMVRNITGVLTTIGVGEQPIDWCKHVLDSKKRSEGGVTAPASGLYFIHAGYDQKFSCPQFPRWPILGFT